MDRRKRERGWHVYRVWYGDVIAYVGRTERDPRDRLREHFTSSPSVRSIDPKRVTDVEVATFATQADAYLYEIYFICAHRPPLNVDDVPRDELTARLPEPEWEKVGKDELAAWRARAAAPIDAAEADRSAALWKAAAHERALREAIRKYSGTGAKA